MAADVRKFSVFLVFFCLIDIVICTKRDLGADIFGALGDLTNSLGLGDTQCEFKCPAGRQAYPNPSHTPYSNGCGSYGFQIDTSAFPEITKCCDQHDICYDTCGSKRNMCDLNFKKCLSSTCQTLYDEGKLKSNQFDACEEISSVGAIVVASLGCETFLKSQAETCICLDEKPPTKTPTDQSDVIPDVLITVAENSFKLEKDIFMGETTTTDYSKELTDYAEQHSRQ